MIVGLPARVPLAVAQQGPARVQIALGRNDRRHITAGDTLLTSSSG